MAKKKNKIDAKDRPFEVGEVVRFRQPGSYLASDRWGKITKISEAGVISVAVKRRDRTEIVLHRPSRYGRMYRLERPTPHEIAMRIWRVGRPEVSEVTAHEGRWSREGVSVHLAEITFDFNASDEDRLRARARLATAISELVAIAGWLDKRPADPTEDA